MCGASLWTTGAPNPVAPPNGPRPDSARRVALSARLPFSSVLPRCAPPCFPHFAVLDLRLVVFVWQFGHVLTAVIRIREPTPEIAHNSWALVAFAETNSVDRLLGSDAVASLKSGEGMTFTAKRIDPQLAISSTGSFGQIFQTCRDRVAQARAIALACADSKLTYQLRDR